MSWITQSGKPTHITWLQIAEEKRRKEEAARREKERIEREMEEAEMEQVGLQMFLRVCFSVCLFGGSKVWGSRWSSSWIFFHGFWGSSAEFDWFRISTVQSFGTGDRNACTGYTCAAARAMLVSGL